jgi:hypothetical protein
MLCEIRNLQHPGHEAGVAAAFLELGETVGGEEVLLGGEEPQLVAEIVIGLGAEGKEDAGAAFAGAFLGEFDEFFPIPHALVGAADVEEPDLG